MKRVVSLLIPAVAFTALAATAAVVTSGTSLVTTSGSSMEPRVSTGDLVLIRPAATYRVGDAVAYRSAELRTVVFHRIVGLAGDRVQLQGDNNSWVDPEQPTRSQLLGKEWLHVPHAGTWLGRLSSPPALAAIVFLLLVSGGVAGVARSRRRHRAAAAVPTGRSRTRGRPGSAGGVPTGLRGAVAVLGAVGLVTAGLGVAAWTHPVPSAGATPPPAATPTRVTFDYTATVPATAAYDGTTVSAPAPVFRRLADEVVVGIHAVTGTSAGPATVDVVAELSAANGWRSVLPLTPPTSFTGGRYDGSVRLRLPDLQARISAAAAAIGAPPGVVGLRVVPRIEVGGGIPFRPTLAFELDDVALRFVGGPDSLTVTQPPAGTTAVAAAPAGLRLLRWSVPVGPARTSSVVAGLLVLLAGCGLAAWTWRFRRTPEPTRLAARYASVLLDVEPVVQPAGKPVVDVTDVPALVRVAERYGLLVLHWERSGIHTYVVQDDAAVYRCRIESGRPAADSSAAAETPAPARVAATPEARAVPEPRPAPRRDWVRH